MICMSVGCTVTQAHDFWIAASPARAQPGQSVVVTANVGDDSYPVSQNVTLPERIESLRLVGPGTTTLTPSYRVVGKSLAAEVQLPPIATTFMAVMNVKGRFISMPPKEFADYLREEGLVSVLAERQQRGEAARPSRERYSRQAKTLIRAGDGPSAGVTRPAGIVAEIVPATDFTQARAGDKLRFQLLFEGKPVAGAQVSLYSSGTADIKSRRQVVHTRADGHADVELTGSGPYLLTTTLMYRRDGETGPEAADWESYWVSLTFDSVPAGT
jgi:hypothetical protein